MKTMTNPTIEVIGHERGRPSIALVDIVGHPGGTLAVGFLSDDGSRYIVARATVTNNVHEAREAVVAARKRFNSEEV